MNDIDELFINVHNIPNTHPNIIHKSVHTLKCSFTSLYSFLWCELMTENFILVQIFLELKTNMAVSD